MNLPEQYYPVRVCPHIGEGLHFRLMFAECGSYENVNLRMTDKGEGISFLPQKGQGSVKNLTENIPSLPLFNGPLIGKWKEWDSILGMKNYNEMQKDLTYLIKIVQANRGMLRNFPTGVFSTKFHACNKVIQDCYHNGLHDLTELSTDQYTELVKKLDQLLNTKYTKFEKAIDACAYGTNCLEGYNRDFYGGVLSVVAGNSNQSADILVHAGGTSFQDIYLTESSCKLGGRLRHARLLDKISLDEPVYQIVSSSLCSDEGLLCARQKHKCVLISSKSGDDKLEHKDVLDIPQELLTSVNFSQYMNNELLLSTKSGSIFLWNINTSSKHKLLVKTQDTNSKNQWSCSYFGGHPRHVVVANTTSVAMFDHRSHFTDGIDLFSLSPNLTKKDERIMAATFLEFPFHAVVTDYAVFMMDQRFPLAPVLQWSTEFICSPQYIQILHQQQNLKEQEKIIFVASQQPPEVMCFPISTQRDNSPISPVVPWRLSQIGDFCQSTHTSYPCDLMKTERRFQASLAGIAVSTQSAENGFTVYQVDSYGDLFYQSLIHSPEDLYKLQRCTGEERQEADKQAESWLKAFEHSAKHETSQLECLSTNLAPNILNNIFSQASSKTITEHKPACHTPHQKLHRKLKSLKQLHSKGSSSKLHLALRENVDIMEFLQKREKDHTSKKKKMRRLNLKALREKKKVIKNDNTKKKPRKRRKVSNYYCKSDTTTDDDDVKRNTSTKDTNRSSDTQDGCDHIVEQRTSTVEDCDTEHFQVEDFEMICGGSSPVPVLSDAGCSNGNTLEQSNLLKQGDSTQMIGSRSSCANLDMSTELLYSNASPEHTLSRCDKYIDESSPSCYSTSSLSDTDGTEGD